MLNTKQYYQPRLSFSLAAAIIGLSLVLGSAIAKDTITEAASNGKHVLGPIVDVEETESEFTFPARVDTGATTSSLHVENSEITDEAGKMNENVGKTIRFRVKNQCGETEWLERKIKEISVIKTSEREERRYKVPVTLECQGVKKRILVSLNDRSHMAYPMLLGRNFLRGDFVVDVSLSSKHVEGSDQPGKRQEKKPPCKSEDGKPPAQKKKPPAPKK